MTEMGKDTIKNICSALGSLVERRLRVYGINTIHIEVDDEDVDIGFDTDLYDVAGKIIDVDREHIIISFEDIFKRYVEEMANEID